jgi:hypothetical protein
MAQQPSFEQTYPQYPFAELVRLSIVLAEFMVRRRPAAEPAQHSGPASACV